MAGNNVKVSIDGSESVSGAALAAAAAIEALDGKKITIDVEFDQDKLDKMKKDVDAIQKQSKDIGKDAGDFDLDTKKARDKLTHLHNRAKELGEKGISLDIDTDSADGKLDRILEKKNKFSESTKIELDAGPANSKLDRLAQKKDKIFAGDGTGTKFILNTDDARDKLNTFADETKDIKINIDADSIVEDIEDINLALDSLTDKTINIDVDAGKAMAEIRALDAALNGVDRRHVDIDADINDAEILMWRNELESLQRDKREFERNRDGGFPIPADLVIDDKRMKQLEKRIAEKQKDIKVKTDLDNSEVEAAGLQDKTVKVKVEIYGLAALASLHTMLKDLRDKTIRVNVETDNGAAVAKATGVGKNSTSKIVVDVNKGEIDKLKAEIDELQNKHIRVDVDSDKINKLSQKIDKLKGNNVDIDADLHDKNNKIREISKQIESLKEDKILLRPDVDISKVSDLNRRIDALSNRDNITGLNNNASLIKNLESERDALKNKVVEVKVDTDFESIARLEAELEAIAKDRDVSVNVKTKNLDRISQAKKDLNALTRSNANIQLDIDDAKISELEAKIKAIQNKTVTVDVKTNSKGFDNGHAAALKSAKDLDKFLNDRDSSLLESKIAGARNELERFKTAGKNIKLDVDDAKIQKVQKILDSLNVHVNDSKERDDLIRDYKKAKSDIESKPISLRTDFDKSSLKTLNRSLDELTRERRITLEVDDANVLRRDKVANELSDLQNARNDKYQTIKMQADLDTAAAETRLAALTAERRTIKINTDVDRSKLDGVSNALGNVSRGFTRALGNVDDRARSFRNGPMARAGQRIDSFADGVNNVVASMTRSIPVVGGMFRGLSALSGAIGPVGSLGITAGAVGVISTALSGLSAAGIYAVAGGLSVVAGGIGVIGSLLGAGFVGGFAAIAAQAPEIKEAYSGMFEGVKTSMVDMAKVINPAMLNMAGALGAAFKTVEPNLQRIASGVGDVIQAMSGDLPAVANALGPALEQAFGAGSKQLMILSNSMPGIITGLGNAIDSAFGSQKSLDAAQGFWSRLPGWTEAAGKGIEGLAGGFNAVMKFMDSGAIDGLKDGMGSFFKNLANADWSSAINGLSGMANAFGNVMQSLDINAVSDVIGGVTNGIASVTNWTASAIQGYNKVDDAIKNVSDSVNSGNLIDDSKPWYKRLFDGDPIVSEDFSKSINKALTSAGLGDFEAPIDIEPKIREEQVAGQLAKVIPAAFGGKPVPLPITPVPPPGFTPPLGTDGKPMKVAATPDFGNLAANTLPFLGDPIKLPANLEFNPDLPILFGLNDLHVPAYIDPILPKVLPPGLGGLELPPIPAPKFEDFKLPFLEKQEVEITPKWNFSAPLEAPPVEVPGVLKFDDLNLPFIGKPVEVPGVLGPLILGNLAVPPVPVEGQLRFSDLALPFLGPVTLPGLISPLIPGATPGPIQVPGSIQFGPMQLPQIPTIQIPSVITPPPPPPMPPVNPIRIPLVFDVQKPNLPSFPNTTSTHTVEVHAQPLPSYPNTGSTHTVIMNAPASTPSYPNTSSTHTVNIVVNGSLPGGGGGGGGNIAAAPLGSAMGALGAMSAQAKGLGSAMGAGMSSGGRGVSQIQKAGESISNSIAAGLIAGKDSIDKAVNEISSALGVIPEQVDKYLTDNSPEYAEAKRIGAEIVGNIGKGITDAQGAIDGAMQGVQKLIADPIGEIDKFLSANVPGYDIAKQQVQGFVDTVGQTMSGLEAAAKVGSDGFQKIIAEEFVMPPMEQVIAKAQEIGDGIGAALMGDPTKLAGTMDGIGQSIATKLSTVGGKVGVVMDQVNQTMRDKVPGFADAQDKAIEFGNGLVAGVDNARVQMNQQLSAMGLPTIPTPQMAIAGVQAEVAKVKTAFDGALNGLRVQTPAPIVPRPDINPVMQALGQIPGAIPTINKVQSDADKVLQDINKIPEVVNTRAFIDDNVGKVEAEIKKLQGDNTESTHTIRVQVANAAAVSTSARGGAMGMAMGASGLAMGAGSSGTGLSSTMSSLVGTGKSIAASLASGITQGSDLVSQAIASLTDFSESNNLYSVMYNEGKLSALGFADGMSSQYGIASVVGEKLGKNILASTNIENKLPEQIQKAWSWGIFFGAFQSQFSNMEKINQDNPGRGQVTYYNYTYQLENNFSAGLIGDPELQASLVLDVLEQSPQRRRMRKVLG